MVLQEIVNISTIMIPFGLIIALVLFVRLGIRASTIRSLQAELSIFLIIWVDAELLRALLTLNLIHADATWRLTGLFIHTVSMVVFGIFLMVRFYRLSHVERGV